MAFPKSHCCHTGPQLQLGHPGKVNIATMAADTLFSSTLWCNAYFADMERVETGVECAFQFMAAFAVPADTSDTCALMAWLTRWAALPMGLIVHCPPDMTPRLLKHVTHNVEKMVKASSLSTTSLQILRIIAATCSHPQYTHSQLQGHLL